jgi:hypothetical protein
MYYAREYERFEYAHMIRYENYGALDFFDITHPADVKTDSGLFQSLQNIVRSFNPFFVVVHAFNSQAVGCINDFEKSQ